MYSFKNDYSEGMHPNILKALHEANQSAEESYGYDQYCSEAQKLIQKQLECDSVDVHFITTGTQANLVALASMLRPHESVIAAKTGHIAMHEAGAIEAIGHKINTIDVQNGKLKPADIQQVLLEHSDEHMVKPKLVYISNSTELGSIYSAKELTSLSAFCKKEGLFLYLDGARLGYALASVENDLKFSDLPKLLDAFCIGGTKNGGMFGEAVVIVNPQIQKDFRYIIKQKGGLLSKSRFLGAQFVEFFKESLYLDNARLGNGYAQQLKEGIMKAGYSFLTPSSSNMIFPILPNPVIEKLKKEFDFYVWKEIDAKSSAIRLVTHWATAQSEIEKLLKLLK